MAVNSANSDLLVDQLQERFGLKLKSPARILASFYDHYREAWEKEFTTEVDDEQRDAYLRRAPHGEDGWQLKPGTPSKMSVVQRDNALKTLVHLGIVESEERKVTETERDYSARKPDGSHYGYGDQTPTKQVERVYTYYRLAPAHRETKPAWLEQYGKIEDNLLATIERAQVTFDNTRAKLVQVLDDGSLGRTLRQAEDISTDEPIDPYASELRRHHETLRGCEQNLRHAHSAVRINRRTLAEVRAFIERLRAEIASDTNTIDGEAVEAPKELEA
jgi:hypothetical protein